MNPDSWRKTVKQLEKAPAVEPKKLNRVPGFFTIMWWVLGVAAVTAGSLVSRFDLTLLGLGCMTLAISSRGRG